MNSYSPLLIFLFIFFLISCKPDALTEKDLLKYIHDPGNGLIKNNQSGDKSLQLVYQSSDLIMLPELIHEGEMDSLVDHSLRKKYDEYLYFILSISVKGKPALEYGTGSYPQFGEVLQNLSFRMRELVILTSSEHDTLYILDSVMPRNFGKGASTDILIAFKRALNEETDWINIQLSEFGLGTGRINFKFKWKDIRRIPRLKIPNNNISSITNRQ